MCGVMPPPPRMLLWCGAEFKAQGLYWTFTLLN